MAFPIAAIAGPLLKGIFSVVDKAVEDKDKATEIKASLQDKLIAGNMKELDAAMNIIVAEAQGGSWIQRSWRPITMLTFVALVVAKWLGVTAPGVSEAVELELMKLIQIGLGGYIVGRSGEKMMKSYKER